MWIPELLQRIQGGQCNSLAATTLQPETSKLINSTTIWKDLKYDSYGKRIPAPGFNDSSYEDHGSTCDPSIDSKVSTVTASYGN